MTFKNFILKYYSPHHQAELVSILNDHSVYSEIETSLNDFYMATEGGNKNDIISQLVLTSSEVVMIINKIINNFSPGDQKNRLEYKITELIIFLIKDTSQQSGLESYEYSELLFQTTRKTYAKHSWDFSLMEKMLYFQNIKTLTNYEKETKNGNNFKLSKPVKLEWQGDKQLDLFVDDLTKTFSGTKCKKLIYYLFDGEISNFKIELPSKHLSPFLVLFYKLHKSGTIKVIGNRGLYVYLHHHLQAPANESYPKRNFRKLRHEAEQNKLVKSNTSLIINPMLVKYCINGR